jgi:hypothetical protein
VWLLRAPATTDNRGAESPGEDFSPAFFCLRETCEHGEIAVQLCAPDVIHRGQYNMADEATQDLGGLGHGIRRVERLSEALNLAAVEFRKFGMEPQYWGRLGGTEAHFLLLRALITIPAQSQHV